jgi:hypothetical protein
MSTRIGTLLACAALALQGAAAHAAIENVENAYESDVAHVTLPSSTAGQVVIRECAGCTPVVLRVDGKTRYFVGAPSSPPVSLAELRSAAGAEDARGRLLVVFYDLRTNVVTRIVLNAA